MISPQTRDALIKWLWPTASSAEQERRCVFAILDGARDEVIEPMVRKSALPHDCLYDEPITDNLRAAAPHIVELTPDAAFTQKLLDRGWGNSWGIFVIAYRPVALKNVRRNFRKINFVLDPSGNKLLFRYYDPRVLRIYLPTCNEEELKTIFGPVTEMIAEAREPGSLHHFTFDGKLCREEVVAIADIAETKKGKDAPGSAASFS